MIIDDSFYEAANNLLVSLGAPLTAENVNLIAAWSYCEKPHYPGAAWQGYNPWNTTLACCNWTGNLNSVGVKIYPTKQDGIEANRRTILNRRYPTLVDAIRNSNPNQFLSARDEIETWGTSPDCIRSIYNSLSPPPDWSLESGSSSGGTSAEEQACIQAGGIWNGQTCTFSQIVITPSPVVPILALTSGVVGAALMLYAGGYDKIKSLLRGRSYG